MKIPSYLSIFGLVLVAISFAACGGGGGSSGNDPTLGITSIQKMGGTAIPNQSVSSRKPTLAKHFMRGIDLLFGEESAHALTASCPPSAPTSFDLPGGKVCLEEVFIILDEVQFNISPISSESPDDLQLGPFGLDLLNTDPGVSQAFDITVPPGKYNNVRFKVKRVDDTQSAGSKVPENLIAKIRDSDSTKKRRPSVWIKGCIDDETVPSTCQAFKFVTDRRWKEVILFNEFSGGRMDAVLELNLEKAFNAALDSLQKNATDLRKEIGVVGINFMGPDFLDGRKKDPDHGTLIAEMIADQLPLHFKILIQSANSVNFEDFPPGTSLIDDTATQVSQIVRLEDVKDLPEDENLGASAGSEATEREDGPDFPEDPESE